MTEPAPPSTLESNAWSGEPVGDAIVADATGWSLGGGPLWKPIIPMRPDKAPDPTDFSDPRVGWGLVLPDRPDLPESERVGAADAPPPLQKLLAARAPAARVFRYVPGPATGILSLRDYAAGKDVAISGSPEGIGEGKLPKYLLLYGGPDLLPWGLQYQLNANRHVGRLDLTGPELENYVNALLHGFPVSRYDAPVVWSVDLGDITEILRTHIGAKLAAKLTADAEMPHTQFLDGAERTATIADLRAALVANSPSLVVTTSHGMTGPLDKPDQMAANLGLPVDGLHGLLDPDVLLTKWQPAGAIWYAHACCSAGADATTAFAGLLAEDSAVHKVLSTVASVGPRVAPLPRALLGASSPARAFVGHVEPTFDWTVSSPFTGQPLTDSIITALYDGLCSGEPVGLALNRVYEHIGEMASAHEQAHKLFNTTFGTAPSAVTAATYTKLAWLDRQSTVILGDPTVAIPLPA